MQGVTCRKTPVSTGMDGDAPEVHIWGSKGSLKETLAVVEAWREDPLEVFETITHTQKHARSIYNLSP